MSKKAVRATVSVVVLLGAISLLFYTTMRSGAEYYKHVEEVADNPQAWYGKNLQLHGFARDVEVIPNSLDYRFEVQSNGKVMKASYRGVVPDTFKDGAEVVLKGRLGPDGFRVEPGGVMAKCPSRYEASRASSQ